MSPEPNRLAKLRWKTMSDKSDAEDELRTAYEQLIDEVGEAEAFQILDDLRSEASSAMYSGEQFVAGVEPVADDETEDEDDSHEYDVDERVYVEEHNGVKVVDGNNAYQDVRGTVELTEIEDDWLILEGDTYDAKDHIKRVGYDYYDFDGQRKVWKVAEKAVEDVHKFLNLAGFLFVDARNEPEPEASEPEGPTPSDQLREILEDVEEGDRIRVTYEQKNGEKMNDKEGVVRETRLPEEEEFTDFPVLRFQRDDGQRMYVKPDTEYDPTLALYTAMSHAPFVGDVEEVEVVEEED